MPPKSIQSMKGALGGLATAYKHGGESMTRAMREGAWNALLTQVDRDFPGIQEPERSEKANLLRTIQLQRGKITARTKRERARKRRLTNADRCILIPIVERSE